MNALCDGARVAAVIRSGQVRYDLDASSVLNAGDTVVLIGAADSLAKALHVFTEDAARPSEAAPIGD
jgi:K+/H+ antiporter YhaU regulatory subunit KhtT